MEPSLPDTDLVVATPERVSFDYQLAGLGTRGIAQILDLLIVAGILLGLFFFSAAAGVALQSDAVANLINLIGTFVVVFGYFWVSEALWSGQTLGKRAFRLRVVGDRGEPLTFAQAGIRNVIRLIDFLPYGYGVGLAILFINGRGKRLGDLAAGTIVVKDSDAVWLWQLPGARPTRPPGFPPPPPPPPPPPGAQPGQPPRPAPAVPSPYTPASQAELTLRRLDPELRRFIASYARRRPQLALGLRAQLATSLQPSLRAAVPAVFEEKGPLAALDHLADLELQ